MSQTNSDARPDWQHAPPQVPDFDLLRPVGQGGFGEVWLAINRTTGCLRAVKMIPLRQAGHADPAAREITSLARLETRLDRQHPNLMTIHHVGKTADYLFYVMDAADDARGGAASNTPDYRPATLQTRLQDGPLPADDCREYAGQLLAGLASLHAAGMVHRDVKPANCLFVGGQLKLADFGLVTEVHPLVSRIGTQKYMPPDGCMDKRADVYAAGLVIYEMLSGLPVDDFPMLGRQAERAAQQPNAGHAAAAGPSRLRARAPAAADRRGGDACGIGRSRPNRSPAAQVAAVGGHRYGGGAGCGLGRVAVGASAREAMRRELCDRALRCENLPRRHCAARHGGKSVYYAVHRA